MARAFVGSLEEPPVLQLYRDFVWVVCRRKAAVQRCFLALMPAVVLAVETYFVVAIEVEAVVWVGVSAAVMQHVEIYDVNVAADGARGFVVEASGLRDALAYRLLVALCPGDAAASRAVSTTGLAVRARSPLVAQESAAVAKADLAAIARAALSCLGACVPGVPYPFVAGEKGRGLAPGRVFGFHVISVLDLSAGVAVAVVLSVFPRLCVCAR